MEQPIEQCVTCGRSVRRDRSRHVVTRDQLETRPGFAEYILQRMNMNIDQVANQQMMCYRCLVAARRHEDRVNQENEHANVTDRPQDEAGAVNIEVQDQSVNVPSYKRLSNTSNRCMFRGCTNVDLLRIPKYIIINLLIHLKIYTPNSARVCHPHLQSNIWSDLSLDDNDVLRTIESFSVDQINDMLETQRTAYLEKRE